MPYFNAAHALRGDRLGARRHRGVAWSAVVLSAATAAATLAPNAAAQRAAPGTVTTTAAVSGVGSFNTGLDGAGSFRYAGVIASGSITKQIDAQWSVGINARLHVRELVVRHRPRRSAPKAPWGSINRPSVGFNVAYQAGPGPRVLRRAAVRVGL